MLKPTAAREAGHAPAGEESTSADPDVLSAELAERRRLDQVRRADELAAAQDAADFERANADLVATIRQQERDRVEREAAGRTAAELARMRRKALAAGEQLRLTALMSTSGEARAERLVRLRVWNLRVLVPALLLFGAWSTAGVQRGAVTLFNLSNGDVGWWAMWGVEPGLIALVCWIIRTRGELAASGGKLEPGVEIAMGGALLVSVGLNVAGGGHIGGPGGQSWTEVLGHGAGPVLAAATAWLIGAIDRSITHADPWKAVNGVRPPSILDVVPEPATPGIAPVVESTTPPVAPGYAPGAPGYAPAERGYAPVGDPVAPGYAPVPAPGDAPAPPVVAATEPAAETAAPVTAPVDEPAVPGVAPASDESADTPAAPVQEALSETAPEPLDHRAELEQLGSAAAKVRMAIDALGGLDQVTPQPVAEWLAARGADVKPETIKSAIRQERKRTAREQDDAPVPGVVQLQRRTNR